MQQSFAKFFRQATGNSDPYPYQVRFAEAESLPHLLRAPTGAGKTATAILGWLYRWLSGKPGTPRRLALCSPMRVLVEQPERKAREWLENLKLDVPVHVLMGGVEAEEWYLQPEKPAILIGTQDMLLSRALNRGYAASRFHWPIDFAFLNNDCLWVFDEPQLMASGVSTSAQLAGLRQSLTVFGNCPSVWMSATLEPSWLDTIDFRGKFTEPPLELDSQDYDPSLPLFKRMTAEKTLRPLGAVSTKDMRDVARSVRAKHVDGTQTLVVVNTVGRATDLYRALTKELKASDSIRPLFIHSRFRPHERVSEKDKDGNITRIGLNDQIQAEGDAAKDRIIVATQVVEAGVDISSRTLITELAPWSSIVQRIGRCNRTGDDGPGQVYWIDLEEKQYLPYSAEDLDRARTYLTKLQDRGVSPKQLGDFKAAEGFELRFEHKHVLRRRDLLDLFDTTPDLSGNDIDIQRFVRGDDPETDVQVFWRASPPSNKWDATERRRQAVRRVELCNVPIGSFKADFLGEGKMAYRFDPLEGEWREVRKKDAGSVVPGQVFWVVAHQGGYDQEIGWSPIAGQVPDSLLIPLPVTAPPRRGLRPEGFYDSDEWSEAEWRTIAEHTNDVVRTLAETLRPDHQLPVPPDVWRILEVAARWHDWGKAHEVFQSGVADVIGDPREKQLSADQRRPVERPEKVKASRVIAKAPDEFWRRYSRVVRAVDPETGRPERRTRVKRFRHELATVLGVLALERAKKLPADWNLLDRTGRLLALYLIAAHHGKLRLSIRAMPSESPVPPDPERRRFAAGVWEGDKLPGADLGHKHWPPDVTLSLDVMQLGSAESWSAGMLGLRDDPTLGPFRLAYLEALLRVADCRASAEGEDDVNE